MDTAALVCASIAATLALAQAATVAFRLPACVPSADPPLLVVFLAAMAWLAASPSGTFLGASAGLLALWSGSAFLIAARQRRWLAAWTGLSSALALVQLASIVLGHSGTVPGAWLSLCGRLLMAAPALGLLLHAARSAGPAVSTIIAASVCAALAGRVVFSWAAISLVPVLLCSGWLVWRNGYPLSPGWRGLLPGRSRARDPAAGAYARLAATEGALLSQNRREAGGFLALGAAHEFRGALSRIRLVATHGLSLQEAVDKDAGLRLILDHASHAESAAVDLLDRISSDFPESPVEMAAARDLEDVVRMARASCRAQGVVLRVDLQAGVVFTARRNDVELILLNLVQNAVQAVSRSVCLVPPEICFSAVTKEEMAILEVRDQAGGVPADRAHLLFMPGASGSGSSGIGLYISRNLAEANGGSLEHEAVDGGSVFRLSFPAAGA